MKFSLSTLLCLTAIAGVLLGLGRTVAQAAGTLTASDGYLLGAVVLLVAVTAVAGAARLYDYA